MNFCRLLVGLGQFGDEDYSARIGRSDNSARIWHSVLIGATEGATKYDKFDAKCIRKPVSIYLEDTTRRSAFKSSKSSLKKALSRKEES